MRECCEELKEELEKEEEVRRLQEELEKEEEARRLQEELEKEEEARRVQEELDIIKYVQGVVFAEEIKCIKTGGKVQPQVRDVLRFLWFTGGRLDEETELHKRTKWHVQTRGLREGDVVLIVDTSLPRNQWKLGRVIEGVEGDKHSARIRTTRGDVVRPLAKLCLLEPVHATKSDGV